mmetsp:Transcript_48391/g.102905  ORF Transcript_48391/g.102905 Transcript_48391/m.102905 type:complete len:92 (+) Transcript_48391:419-694(+)
MAAKLDVWTNLGEGGTMPLVVGYGCCIAGLLGGGGTGEVAEEERRKRLGLFVVTAVGADAADDAMGAVLELLPTACVPAPTTTPPLVRWEW